jgi:hypothetical protein
MMQLERNRTLQPCKVHGCKQAMGVGLATACNSSSHAAVAASIFTGNFFQELYSQRS